MNVLGPSRLCTRALQAPARIQFSASTIAHTIVWTKGFHTNKQLWAEKKDDKPEDDSPSSIRGQLYASTYQRLQKERADEDRFVKARAERRSGTWQRTISTSIGLIAVGLMGWYLGNKAPHGLNESSTTTLAESVPPQFDNRKSVLQAAWTDFALIVGKENVSDQKDDLDAHSGSEYSSYATKSGERPFAIVYPATTEEVSKIMQVCHKRKIPVTALSGGTSLEGHFAPTRGGICIDMMRMDKIIDFNPHDLDIKVQPALGWEDLNEYLHEKNMFFPPDPGPGARIGGMVGTGCSGTNAYRYGTMREWVLSLTVVLADGTVIKTRQRPRKSSAGYDLTRLLIGSEGTLGLVTEATLKLTVRPPSTSVAVAAFPSIRSAAACVARVVGDGVPIAAIEILDDEQMRAINEADMTERKWREAPTLFFKFAGTAAGVKEQVALVRDMAKKSGSESFDFARSTSEQEELWSARKEALWSTMALRREGDHVWTGDVAVPISRLPDLIEETKGDLKASGLQGTIVGHAGDGNFHSTYTFLPSFLLIVFLLRRPELC